MSDARPPAVAGMFYPSNPDKLRRTIQELLAEASVKKIPGELLALVCPHAGYKYSGLTAAHAYKLLLGTSYDTVIVVSPSHREIFDGASVYSGSAYQTPLGNLPVDDVLREEILRDSTVIHASLSGHRQEHAVEVQLPFLQLVLRDFKILPIVIGEQKRESCYHLGEKLAAAARGRKVLLVASTDLSHFYPAATAEKLDRVIIDDIAKLDHGRMMSDLETDRGEACGGGPAVAVMLAAKKLGANTATILHHSNSGDVTGDLREVVGYLSAAISRKE